MTGTVANPLNIFSQPTQVAGSAMAMSVVMTDPNQIAAAGVGQGTGDNSNATAMATLANQSIVNGQTPTNYYSNFVSTLGATVSGVQDGEYGAECLGDAVADAERCAVRRQSERRGLCNDHARAQLSGRRRRSSPC